MSFVFTQSLGYALNHCAILVRYELMQRFENAGYDITGEEWAVMALLYERNTGVSQGELAEQTIKDKTTMVRLIDRLTSKGLVVRKVSSEDKRIKSICLTSAGARLSKSLVAIAQGLLKELSAELPREEVKITMKTLHTLMSRLKQI